MSDPYVQSIGRDNLRQELEAFKDRLVFTPKAISSGNARVIGYGHVANRKGEDTKGWQKGAGSSVGLFTAMGVAANEADWQAYASGDKPLSEKDAGIIFRQDYLFYRLEAQRYLREAASNSPQDKLTPEYIDLLFSDPGIAQALVIPFYGDNQAGKDRLVKALEITAARGVSGENYMTWGNALVADFPVPSQLGAKAGDFIKVDNGYFAAALAASFGHSGEAGRVIAIRPEVGDYQDAPVFTTKWVKDNVKPDGKLLLQGNGKEFTTAPLAQFRDTVAATEGTGWAKGQ